MKNEDHTENVSPALNRRHGLWRHQTEREHVVAEPRGEVEPCSGHDVRRDSRMRRSASICCLFDDTTVTPLL